MGSIGDRQRIIFIPRPNERPEEPQVPISDPAPVDTPEESPVT